MSGFYPVHRTPEQGHTKQCLAKAVIAAVENLRDDEEETDLDFRLALQRNYPLELADEYLAEGMTRCLCPRDRAAERRREILEAARTSLAIAREEKQDREAVRTYDPDSVIEGEVVSPPTP